MPTNRKRKMRVPKGKKGDIPEWLEKWFVTGIYPTGKEEGALDCFLLSGPGRKDELKATWESCWSVILRGFIRDKPGRRPWPWWKFDSPENRLKLSGQGLADHEKYKSIRPSFFIGIPKYFSDIDENDPLLYESEAAFLKRENLLSKAEEARLTAEDFEPVTVEEKTG